MPTKVVRIACEAAAALPLSALLEFQGTLKEMTKVNADRLRWNILTNGFIVPKAAAS